MKPMNGVFTLIFCLVSSKSMYFSSLRFYTLTLIPGRIRRKRPSLRLIVSSATLDATSFLDYFTAGTSSKEATIVSLEGRMFPVEIAYLQEPVPDYVLKAAVTAFDINNKVMAHPTHWYIVFNSFS